MTYPMTHRYYRSPYEVKLATDKQYDYILSLLRDHEYNPDIPLSTQLQIIEESKSGKRDHLTRKAASDMINAILMTPKRAPLGITQHEPPALEDGFYEAAGRTFKLLTSMQGRRYAKVLNDQGKWEYAPGAMGIVGVSGEKLSLERAKELGKLYGRCIICGAILTDEKSIEAGIGPVCAKRV